MEVWIQSIFRFQGGWIAEVYDPNTDRRIFRSPSNDYDAVDQAKEWCAEKGYTVLGHRSNDMLYGA